MTRSLFPGLNTSIYVCILGEHNHIFEFVQKVTIRTKLNIRGT